MCVCVCIGVCAGMLQRVPGKVRGYSLFIFIEQGMFETTPENKKSRGRSLLR